MIRFFRASQVTNLNRGHHSRAKGQGIAAPSGLWNRLGIRRIANALVCLLALLALAGCNSAGDAVVARFPGGTVTQKELKHVWKQQNPAESNKQASALLKGKLRETAQQIALHKYIMLQGKTLEQDPMVKARLEVAAMDAAATKWRDSVREKVVNELTAKDVQDYTAKHQKELKNPGEVAYYFLYLKTKDLQGEQLAAKKAQALDFAKKGKANPDEFPNLAKVHTEAEDPRSGNQIGPISRAALPEYLADILFEKLQVKEVSDPIEIPNGIAVFQVAVRNMGPSPKDAEVPKIAREKLVNEKFSKRLTSETEALREKYKPMNSWLDKEYGKWKDDEVIYRVGPISRTFKQAKAWAPSEETLMCNMQSAELVDFFINRDLAVLGATNGSGKTDSFLDENGKAAVFARAFFLNETMRSPKIMDESMQDIIKQAKMTPQEAPKSIEELAKLAYQRFGGMLGLGSPAWFEIEQVIIEPRPEALRKQGPIPMLQGIEWAHKAVGSLNQGADPKKPENLLPAEAPFKASYVSSAKKTEGQLPEPVIGMLKELPDNKWSDPAAIFDQIILYRILNRRGAMTIPYESAKAEFLPGFKQYLAVQGISKTRNAVLRQIEILPENFPDKM